MALAAAVKLDELDDEQTALDSRKKEPALPICLLSSGGGLNHDEDGRRANLIQNLAKRWRREHRLLVFCSHNHKVPKFGPGPGNEHAPACTARAHLAICVFGVFSADAQKYCR